MAYHETVLEAFIQFFALATKHAVFERNIDLLEHLHAKLDEFWEIELKIVFLDQLSDFKCK